MNVANNLIIIFIRLLFVVLIWHFSDINMCYKYKFVDDDNLENSIKIPSFYFKQKRFYYIIIF